jgi:hypothetical protein
MWAMMRKHFRISRPNWGCDPFFAQSYGDVMGRQFHILKSELPRSRVRSTHTWDSISGGLIMQSHGPLDALSLWGLFMVTLLLVLLSVEAGYRLGKYRRSRSEEEMDRQ